jgi:nitrogen fixation protein FixH
MKKLKFDFWTTFLGLLFLYAFASSGYFLYMAITSNNGLVTENAYEDSLKYQDKINAMNSASEAGYRLRFESADLQLRVQILDEANEPVSGLKLQVEASSPLGSFGVLEEDLLESSSPGLYELSGRLPRAGLWDLVFKADQMGQKLIWERSKKLGI